MTNRQAFAKRLPAWRTKRWLTVCLCAFICVTGWLNGLASPDSLTATKSLVSVNAASYQPILAPGTIAAAFGDALIDRPQMAETIPLPTEIAGLSIQLVDQGNTFFAAPLFFVSASQINYFIPEEIALGEAHIFLVRGRELIGHGKLQITNSAPALFTFSGTGKGIPTALTTLDGINFAPVINPDGTVRPLEPLTSAGKQFILLFGTGFRHAKRLRVKIGPLVLAPTYAGAQGSLTGLDQINLELPNGLPKELQGTVFPLQVISDGKLSNVVEFSFAAKPH